MSLYILIILSCLEIASLHGMTHEIFSVDEQTVNDECSSLPSGFKVSLQMLDRKADSLLRKAEYMHQRYHDYYCKYQPSTHCSDCNDSEMFILSLLHAKSDYAYRKLDCIARMAVHNTCLLVLEQTQELQQQVGKKKYKTMQELKQLALKLACEGICIEW